MSILKETAIAVPALAALLFISHTFYGPDKSQLISAPQTWLGSATFPAERFIAKNLITGRASTADEDSLSPGQKSAAAELTPQARITSVFAQFGRGDVRSST